MLEESDGHRRHPGGRRISSGNDTVSGAGRIRPDGRTQEHDRWRVAHDELVFRPLGGVGEIGMNASLYGFGPPRNRKWILVDCGVAFAGDDLPGIDLIMPDMRFLEEQRANLLGIIITHAHEDHIGALMDLWPRLQAPVFATQFAASLLEIRRFQEPGARKFPMTVVDRGTVLDARPVRGRVHCHGPFHSGVDRLGNPHAGRHGASYG